MKKIYYLFALIVSFCALHSCSDSEEENEEIQGELEIYNNLSYTVSSGENAVEFSFKTNTTWRMWSDSPWCRLEANEGEAGEQTVRAQIAENTTLEDREAMVLIKVGSQIREMNVTQMHKDAILVAQNEYTVDAEGTHLEFEVNANVYYEVTTTAGWIRQLPDTRALTRRMLNFEISPNDTFESREAYILLRGSGLEQQIKISQVKKEAILLAKDEYYLNNEEQMLSFDVRTNVEIDVKTDVDWIKQVASTKDLNEKTYNFKISRNDSYDPREGTITIKSNNLVQKIKVVQAQKDALTISEHEYTLNDEEHILEMSLNTNVDFNVYCNQSWIERLPNTKGLQNYPLKFKVHANQTPDEREGMIRISGGNLTQEVKITQMKHDMIVVAKDQYNLSQSANSLDFEVKANVDYQVTTNVKWIKQRTETKGLVSKMLHFDIEENNGNDSRTGIITVSDGKITKNIQVIQAAKDAIVIAKDEYILLSNETKLEFDVQSNVQLNVTTDVSWIREVTKSRTLDVYPLSFELDENTSYDDRTGTIIIKGGKVTQRIKVIQKQRNAIVLAKKEYRVNCEAKRLDFTVKANVSIVAKANANWVKLVPNTKGLVDIPLSFDIEENTGYNNRECIINISGGGVEQEILLIQESRYETQSVAITHRLRNFTVPVFDGGWVNGRVSWGDYSEDILKENLSHNYSNYGPHTVVIEIQNASKVTIQKLRDIDLIDFSGF